MCNMKKNSSWRHYSYAICMQMILICTRTKNSTDNRGPFIIIILMGCSLIKVQSALCFPAVEKK